MVLSSFCKSEVLIDSESPLISRPRVSSQGGQCLTYLTSKYTGYVLSSKPSAKHSDIKYKGCVLPSEKTILGTATYKRLRRQRERVTDSTREQCGWGVTRKGTEVCHLLCWRGGHRWPWHPAKSDTGLPRRGKGKNEDVSLARCWVAGRQCVQTRPLQSHRTNNRTIFLL